MRNQLINSTKTITDAELFGGIKYDIDINPDNDLMYGCASSASITFTIGNTDDSAKDLMGKTFTWKCQMNGDSASKDMGVFTVADIQKDKWKATLTAYDAINDLEASADEWLTSLTFPITLQNFVKSMAQKINKTITLPTDNTFINFTISQNFITNNVSYRQLLGYVGQVCNLFFVADGAKIVGRDYAASATVIDNTKYSSITMADYTTDPIDKIQVQSTFDDIGYVAGTGTNTYLISENPLFFTGEKVTATATFVSSLLDALKTITYTPMSFKTYNDYGVKVGDILTINGKTCYVMKKTISNTGCAFEGVGNKRRDTQKEEQHSAITALNNKTNELVRDVDGTKSTITSIQGSIQEVKDEQGEITSKMAVIETQYSDFQQTAQGITTTVSDVKTSLENLEGEVDTISTNVSTLEQTANSITATVNSQNETISTIQQTANSLTSTITSQGETITEIRQDLDGINLTGYVKFNDLSTSGSTTINGSNITTGTINADVINVTNLHAANLKGYVPAGCISDSNNYIKTLYATNIYSAIHYTQSLQLVSSSSPGLESSGTLLKPNGVYTVSGGNPTLLATWSEMAAGGSSTKTAVFG